MKKLFFVICFFVLQLQQTQAQEKSLLDEIVRVKPKQRKVVKLEMPFSDMTYAYKISVFEKGKVKSGNNFSLKEFRNPEINKDNNDLKVNYYIMTNEDDSKNFTQNTSFNYCYFDKEVGNVLIDAPKDVKINKDNTDCLGSDIFFCIESIANVDTDIRVEVLAISKEKSEKSAETEPMKPRKKPMKPNSNGDKAVGIDGKGRTIYESVRGGRYTISGNGNKNYIKNK
jgi:hypothetical protein